MILFTSRRYPSYQFSENIVHHHFNSAGRIRTLVVEPYLKIQDLAKFHSKYSEVKPTFHTKRSVPHHLLAVHHPRIRQRHS